jgi:hypothetical protein
VFPRGRDIYRLANTLPRPDKKNSNQPNGRDAQRKKGKNDSSTCSIAKNGKKKLHGCVKKPSGKSCKQSKKNVLPFPATTGLPLHYRPGPPPSELSLCYAGTQGTKVCNYFPTVSSHSANNINDFLNCMYFMPHCERPCDESQLSTTL